MSAHPTVSDDAPVPLGAVHEEVRDSDRADRFARPPAAPPVPAPRRSATDFTSERMLRAQAEPARRGWRMALYVASGGRVNLGPSRTTSCG